MMPGMWVVRPDGSPWQILRLISTSVAGSRGVPVPATRYELLNVTSDAGCYVDQWNRQHPLASLIGRDPEQMVTLPACRECGTSAGWSCQHIATRAGQHTSEGDEVA